MTIKIKSQYSGTYFRGGILRFSAGVRPLSSAFLEWIMKCLAGDREETL